MLVDIPERMTVESDSLLSSPLSTTVRNVYIYRVLVGHCTDEGHSYSSTCTKEHYPSRLYAVFIVVTRGLPVRIRIQSGQWIRIQEGKMIHHKNSK